MELILILIGCIITVCLGIFIFTTAMNLTYWWIRVLRKKLNNKIDIGEWDWF